MKGDPEPGTAAALDLSEDERRGLIALLRHTIDEDLVRMSPRLAPLRAILEKLDRPSPRSELVDAPHPRRRRR
jgi:hypothetical protein